MGVSASLERVGPGLARLTAGPGRAPEFGLYERARGLQGDVGAARDMLRFGINGARSRRAGGDSAGE
jgi:hypothetical protein